MTDSASTVPSPPLGECRRKSKEFGATGSIKLDDNASKTLLVKVIGVSGENGPNDIEADLGKLVDRPPATGKKGSTLEIPIVPVITIRLMPDSGNQRDVTGSGRAHNYFLIEAPQILQRAAAPRNDQDIRAGDCTARGNGIEPFDRSRHLRCCTVPLNQYRPQQDMARKPVGQPVQYIADHRPGRREDQFGFPPPLGAMEFLNRLPSCFLTLSSRVDNLQGSVDRIDTAL